MSSSWSKRFFWLGVVLWFGARAAGLFWRWDTVEETPEVIIVMSGLGATVIFCVLAYEMGEWVKRRWGSPG